MDEKWKLRIQSTVQHLTKEKLVRETVARYPSTQSLCHAREGNNGLKDLVVFSSNDYLGLAGHPEMRVAVSKVASVYGMGIRSSALLGGFTHLHEELQDKLANLTRNEACLLFPTGYAANLSLISSLADRKDVVVFSDSLNHASIIDGCRLAAKSGATVKIYEHSNLRQLEESLKAHLDSYKIVVTESLFSMDGDFAKLKELVSLRGRYGFLLVVDEAHAMLVAGETGGGVAELLGVQQQVDIVVGTLSKAFGAMGGFVCTTTELRSFLVSRARSQIFSTVLPMPVVAAALKAIHLAQRESWRRKHHQQLIHHFASTLGMSAESWVVPIIIGTPEDALEVSRKLKARGYLVPAIRPPTVPSGTCRLRVSLCAGHTFDQVNQLAREIRSLINSILTSKC